MFLPPCDTYQPSADSTVCSITRWPTRAAVTINSTWGAWAIEDLRTVLHKSQVVMSSLVNRLPHLCHNAGSTFGCLKVRSIYAPSCSVNPIGLNTFHVPVHRCEHHAAFKRSILFHRDRQVLPYCLCQLRPLLQDPVSVAVMWEVHAREHLANHVKGHKQAGEAQYGY